MKKILALALPPLLALALAACIQPAPPPTTAPAMTAGEKLHIPEDWSRANVAIDRATEELLAQFEATQGFTPFEIGPGHQRIIITTDKEIHDFQFAEVTYEVMNDEIAFSFGNVLYSVSSVTPDRPFVTTLMIPETIPQNGISFIDGNGERMNFTISESGMDGSLLLIEF